jgi:hypothetical protein
MDARKIRMEPIGYDADVVLWSREQAVALRKRDFGNLDIEHLADEIEDVGKSEQRELINRMAVLIAHLLKWRHQPDRQSRSWRLTIADQRRRLELALRKTPSLRVTLRDADWREIAWLEAVELAQRETGLEREVFPDGCPWTFDDVLTADWLPG